MASKTYLLSIVADAELVDAFVAVVRHTNATIFGPMEFPNVAAESRDAAEVEEPASPG